MSNKRQIISFTAVMILGLALSDKAMASRPYERALKDAEVAMVDEVRKLNPIKLGNKRLIRKNGKVLMASLIPKWAVERFYQPALQAGGNFNSPQVPGVYMWVSPVPELKNFITRYVHGVKKTLAVPLLTRVQNLLGLPESEGDFSVVELWIEPKYLFRPCPDNEIDDDVCVADTVVGKPGYDVFQTVRATPEHKNWYANKKSISYKMPGGFPWTRLGYTYDYYKANFKADPKGLSEYVIQQGSPLILKSITPLERYEVAR